MADENEQHVLLVPDFFDLLAKLVPYNMASDPHNQPRQRPYSHTRQLALLAPDNRDLMASNEIITALPAQCCIFHLMATHKKAYQPGTDTPAATTTKTIPITHTSWHAHQTWQQTHSMAYHL
jgi:hypothetical protein